MLIEIRGGFIFNSWITTLILHLSCNEVLKLISFLYFEFSKSSIRSQSSDLFFYFVEHKGSNNFYTSSNLFAVIQHNCLSFQFNFQATNSRGSKVRIFIRNYGKK